MAILFDILEKSINGPIWTSDEILEILATRNIEDLYDTCSEITQRCAPKLFNMCSIINAKSGRCSQDCHWCTQSRHYQTNCEVYPLLDTNKILEAAKQSQKAGIGRFSIVTSGRKLSRREVRSVIETVRTIKAQTNLEICASLGLMTKSELAELKEAGVCRLHCNLETSPTYFPKVCSTHTQEEKIQTLLAAREVGMDVCSGGILGMGENIKDRVELALTLRHLDLPSIPLNFLVPMKGTPLENQSRLTEKEVLEIVVIFRLINPNAYLRFAGGRDHLTKETIKKAMQIGVNSAISGNLLTTLGSSPEEDRELIKSVGYKVEKEAEK